VAAVGERPFPPGDYPLVIVGSGPGAVQLSYSLSRLGVDHAVISSDPAAGGMFRRFPFFQRLLSWTKPYAPEEQGTRAYQRYDWNSLLADEPENASLMRGLMDGTSYFPSRPEMELNIRTFAERTGRRIRYGCTWENTSVEDGPGGRRFVLDTTDGRYRTPLAVFAVGAADPHVPTTPGIELAAHYADTRPAETYADKRLFIIGKQNSGFELATGLLPWARGIVLASPSPAKLSVLTRSLVGIRARYLQPYEDYVLGGGVAILEAAIDRIERSESGIRVVTRPSQGGEPRAYEADEVIAATGFVAPLRDLASIGVVTFGQSRLPAQSPFWESATVSGIYFAGTVSSGAAGLKKHGMPANSGAVQGARYNARVLARHLAETHFGVAPYRRPLGRDALLPFLVDEISRAPELWHQRAYLARVVEVDATRGIADAGIVPLSHFLDAGGPDAIAATIEADAAGGIYPVVYSRRGGVVTEHVLPGDDVLQFDGPAHRAAVASVLELFGVTAEPGVAGQPSRGSIPGAAGTGAVEPGLAVGAPEQ
jgi:thioredoxin reductase